MVVRDKRVIRERERGVVWLDLMGALFLCGSTQNTQRDRRGEQGKVGVILKDGK